MKTLYLICLILAFLSCKNASHNDTSSTTETNQETSTEQRWMEKIAGADWIDTSAPDHKLVFGKPTIQSSVVTGSLEEHFPGLVNVCKYECISEGNINIHLLKTIRDGVEEQRSNQSSLKLQLADENTLNIHYPDGRTITYKRSQNNALKKEAVTENSSENLWMNKIQGDWKNVMNHQRVKFNKPAQQGDIIKGEVEMHEESFIQVFRYERTADGQMKCKLLRFKITGDKDYTEENGSGNGFDVSFKTELLDDGNNLVLHHSNGTKYTYKH